jgi:hypothetical protein
MGKTNVYSRNTVRASWRIRQHISDTKISNDSWCTYLSKSNIWLLTSSFDISKTNIAERQMKFGGCPSARMYISHTEKKISITLLYILLYICDFACCFLGVPFDSDDGGNTFLRNINKLLPDYTASSQKILFGFRVISCKHADGWAPLVGTSNDYERA